MNEQTILLIFLILALGVTLWLYLLKARKSIAYKDDERWQLIQVKAGRAANLADVILILLLVFLPLFLDTQMQLPLQRFLTFGMLFIGLRNLLELAAIFYFDRQL